MMTTMIKKNDFNGHSTYFEADESAVLEIRVCHHFMYVSARGGTRPAHSYSSRTQPEDLLSRPLFSGASTGGKHYPLLRLHLLPHPAT